jgi:hypothetical protein
MERCILVVKGKEYDVTGFLDSHPGGRDTLLEYSGQDATEAFEDAGHSNAALKEMESYFTGKSVAIQDKKDSVKQQSIYDFKFPEWMGMHFWIFLSSAIAVTCALVAGTPINQSLGDAMKNQHPSEGALGLGRFTIIGYMGGFEYPFRLKESKIAAFWSAWVLYVLHQTGQWYLLFAATRAREGADGSSHSKDRLKWSSNGIGNGYAWAMLILNITFFGLHFIQTHLFYDGLAASVPETTALGSVVAMLAVIYLVEIPRRGMFFGYFPGKHTDTMKDFALIMKKYHGYVASFGIVYDFWYHPMEITAGHYTGFFYQVLLLWQSSLLYQTEHKNRYWTLFLEYFVAIHGLVTAINQGGTMFLMMLFGFSGVFFITQIFGIPEVLQYINKPADEKSRKRRHMFVSIFSIVLWIGISAIVYGALGELKKLPLIATIPFLMYAAALVFVFGFLIARGIEYLLVVKYNVLEKKSSAWWTLAISWSVIVSAISICTYAVLTGNGFSFPMTEYPKH